MPDATFNLAFGILLLASAVAFAFCIGIVRQGSLRVDTGSMGTGTSYVVSPHQRPHEFWGNVVAVGAVGAILLILDLWMLVRHRRAKREAE